MAHGYAPAATLAPLTYLSLVSATALGYLAFGDLPDGPTWLGAAIVVGSGLAVCDAPGLSAGPLTRSPSDGRQARPWRPRDTNPVRAHAATTQDQNPARRASAT